MDREPRHCNIVKFVSSTNLIKGYCCSVCHSGWKKKADVPKDICPLCGSIIDGFDDETTKIVYTNYDKKGIRG